MPGHFVGGHFVGDGAGSGSEVYPDPSDVREGVQYGPNGDDYTGTLVVYAVGGTSSAINTLAAFRDLLLSIASLTSIVSNRVYAIDMPRGGVANFPCVIVNRSPGGSLDDYMPERAVRYDVRAYGVSQPQADQVNRAIQSIDATNDIDIGNYHFDYIKEIQSWDQPEQVTESEKWDCVFSMWEATLHYE